MLLTDDFVNMGFPTASTLIFFYNCFNSININLINLAINTLVPVTSYCSKLNKLPNEYLEYLEDPKSKGIMY